MIQHTVFNTNPENTPKSVKELVENEFKRNPDEAMPELLSEFCTLLGNEKEKWGGRAAMKVCMQEFQKGRDPKEVYHQEDLQTFLFSPNRYIPIVIPGSDSPNTSHAVSQTSFLPPNPKTLKGSDNPSTSHGAIPGDVSQTSVPPPNPKTLKGSDNPSTSQAVSPGAVSQTSVPPANPKTLKVKIYMGSGWDKDFPDLPPPSLWVNIKIEGDKSQENDKNQENDKKQKNDRKQKNHKKQNNDQSQKTKVQKKTWTPCWGEEFEFSLSTLADAQLSLEVHNDKQKNGVAGKACVSVSELKPGIRVIALSEPYTSTWLLMRFML